MEHLNGKLLRNEGMLSKTWKPRSATLDKGILTFVSATNPSHQHGHINLKGYKVTSGSTDSRFILTSKSGHDEEFVVVTERDNSLPTTPMWVDAIKNHIAYANTGVFPTVSTTSQSSPAANIPASTIHPTPTPIPNPVTTSIHPQSNITPLPVPVPTPMPTNPIYPASGNHQGQSHNHNGTNQSTNISPIYPFAPIQDTHPSTYYYPAGTLPVLKPLSPPKPPKAAVTTTDSSNTNNGSHHGTTNTTTNNAMYPQSILSGNIPDIRRDPRGWFTHFAGNAHGTLSISSCAHALTLSFPTLDRASATSVLEALWPLFDMDRSGSIDINEFSKPGGLAEMISDQMPTQSQIHSTHTPTTTTTNIPHSSHGNPAMTPTWQSPAHTHTNTSYYVPNSNTSSSTTGTIRPPWEDSAIKQSYSTQNTRNSTTSSSIVTTHSKQTLPPNWEEAKTADGRIYYINHLTKSTTWTRPI